MKEHLITADIYASWGDVPPRYRIYVDQDLITERDFTWPGTQIYITENILVNLPIGGHTVRIEQINGDNIKVKNLAVDHKPISNNEFSTLE